MFTQSLTHKCSYKIYLIAKNWGKKVSRYPSTGDWINKLLYIHNMAPFIFSLIFFLSILQHISLCSCFTVIVCWFHHFLSILCLFLLSDFFSSFVGAKLLLIHIHSKFLLDAEFLEFYTVEYWIFLNFSEWRASFIQAVNLLLEQFDSLESDFQFCYGSSTSKFALLLRYGPSGVSIDCPDLPTRNLHPIWLERMSPITV